MSLLEKWKDRKIIKVVTGIRRCGKSSLLRMFRDKLLLSGVDESCVPFPTVSRNSCSRSTTTPYHSTTA